MKDRRGTGNQAVLDHAEEDEITKSGGDYAPAPETASDVGGAPKPASSSAIMDEMSDYSGSPEDASSMDHTPLTTPAPASAASVTSGGAVQEAPIDGDGAGAAASGGPAAAPAMANASGYSGGDMGAASSSATGGAPTSGGGNSGSGGSSVPADGGQASGSYAGDDMGWDMVAFAEAGGYDAVLSGELPGGINGDGQDIFVFIDELNLDIVNNTLIQNTEITLIADDGGVLEIGGDFTAIQTQESLVVDGSGGPSSLPMDDGGFIPGGGVPVIEADAGMGCG